MNRIFKTALFYTAVNIAVYIIHVITSQVFYSYSEPLAILTDTILQMGPTIIMGLGGGLLIGFLWNDNPEYPAWKKIVLRTLIGTLLLMLLQTLYTIVFNSHYLDNITIMQYFLYSFENAFYSACVYTLVWLVVPEDVVKEPKPRVNPNVIDNEIKS